MTAKVLADLPGLGIDLDQVSRKLEDEGVEKFNHPFDTLMATINRQRAMAL